MRKERETICFSLDELKETRGSSCTRQQQMQTPTTLTPGNSENSLLHHHHHDPPQDQDDPATSSSPPPIPSSSLRSPKHFVYGQQNLSFFSLGIRALLLLLLLQPQPTEAFLQQGGAGPGYRKSAVTFQHAQWNQPAERPLRLSSTSSSNSHQQSSSSGGDNSTTAELSPEVRDWTTVMSNNDDIWKRGRHSKENANSNMNIKYSNTTDATGGDDKVNGINSSDNDSQQQQPKPSLSQHLPRPSISHANKSALTEYDEHLIQQFWEDLLYPKISAYLPRRHQHDKIYRALRVAYECHHGQMRKSGEPFIVHPVQVAVLLSSLKMDTETIMAGLLHDTVEDTDMTFEQLEELFGPVVKSIVEGETKVSKLPKLAFCPEEEASSGTKTTISTTKTAIDAGIGGDHHHDQHYDEQAENLRQMFVAMTEDYRIIIVKLADRLHNMRTLQHMKPAKQIKISRETLDIFAPLAHRMGIWQFKSELEDISFQYLYPQEYKRLNRKLHVHQERLTSILEESQRLLKEQLQSDVTLQEQAASVEVVGRTKEMYSLWHKMETKGERNLDQIGDVVALRVIITPKQQQPALVQSDYDDEKYEDDGDEDEDFEEEEDYEEYDSSGDDDEEEDDYHQDQESAVEQEHDFASSKSLFRKRRRRRKNSYKSQSTSNHADRGVWLCYHVLGLVQHLPGFQPVPTRVKDYISFPKPNGVSFV
jgi:hypothetical protein